MAENLNESQEARRPAGSSKKFSKVKFLQTLGLLSRNVNYESLEFGRSWSLRLICFLHLTSKPLLTLKIFVSCFWPRNHVAQLWIGSIFNYISGQGRWIIGIAGIGTVLWALSFHFVFNYLNARNNYRLFKVWMKLTLELPAKVERDYRVAGLPTEENKKFWSTENRLNYIWYRVINGYACFIGAVFSTQLFYVR